MNNRNYFQPNISPEDTGTCPKCGNIGVKGCCCIRCKEGIIGLYEK